MPSSFYDNREIRMKGFDSFAALVQYAAGVTAPDAPEINAQRVARYVSGEAAQAQKDSFSGGKIAQGALLDVGARLLGGWPDGVARMREVMEQVQVPVIRSVRRRGAWAAQGDSVDMPRLFSGNVDKCWRTTVRASHASPPRVRILCDIGAAWDVDARDLFYRGAAATTLAEALVQAGYTVEVFGGAHIYGPAKLQKFNAVWTARVKDANAPLNVASLTALLSHPAALRRFGIMMTLRQCHETAARTNLGSAISLRIEDVGALLPGEIGFLVPNGLLDIRTANAWVRGAVASLEKAGAA